jgi:hypothetical protein
VKDNRYAGTPEYMQQAYAGIRPEPQNNLDKSELSGTIVSNNERELIEVIKALDGLKRKCQKMLMSK